MSAPSPPDTEVASAVRMRGVHKRLAGVPVLSGIDCDVRIGESFGLVGANGAGKTTLLKAVLDYIPLDAGEISVFDVPARMPRARQRLAFLPERFTPPYYLRGGDFLAYAAQLYGVAFEAERVRAVFDVVQLDAQALRQSVRQFSKGMAQKLGLAAALLSGRELLILDEPMSGLDAASRVSIQHRLAQLRDAGTTLLFTSHLLRDVQALADRMAIIDRGVLRFVGTPRECQERFGGEDLEAAYLRCTAQGA